MSGGVVVGRTASVVVVGLVSVAVMAALASAGQPRLRLAGCDLVEAEPGTNACVAVSLRTDGARVASVGFTIQYDRAVLYMRHEAADVRRGAALAEGQTLAPVMLGGEDDGRVSVMITPPVRLPIAVIGDGEIATICFAVRDDAPEGCSAVRFVLGSIDMGDDAGADLPMGPARAGGVRVRLDRPGALR